MNRKALVACNFNSLFETEGRLNVTGSKVHCKKWSYIRNGAR